jgi:hypothetical protein
VPVLAGVSNPAFFEKQDSVFYCHLGFRFESVNWKPYFIFQPQYYGRKPVDEVIRSLRAGNARNSKYYGCEPIEIYTPNTIFAASDYLCFEAEPNDIEKFIANSPELEGPTYETSSDWFHDKPSWFHPERIDRIYKFDKKEDYSQGKIEHVDWHGELIIDDDKHIVYVYREKK